MTLNKRQREIIAEPVTATIKALAGAGTGKTRVLVERYLKFVFDDDIAPDRLLALTFTKKAAAEMHGRVFKAVVERGDREVLRSLYGAWIMNFHQFSFRVIKENAAAFGIDPDIGVASEVDIFRIKRRLQRRFEAGDIGGVPVDYAEDMPEPNHMDSYFEKCLEIVDKARGALWTPQSLRATIRARDVPAYGRYLETIIAVWTAYEAELRSRLLLDFPAMIRTVVSEFSQNNKLREHYARRFKHVLVDEFQDTSEAQNKLLMLLTGDDYPRVTVVGDEKQSIYRWRDARIENIRDFAGEKRLLTKNYRSTQTILDVASHMLIEDDYFKARENEVLLTANRGKSRAPVCIFHPQESAEPAAAQEARALGAWILAMTGRLPPEQTVPAYYAQNPPSIGYGDIAILMRTLKASSGLPFYEEELKRLQVPYAIMGGVSRLDEHVLELMKNVLRLLVHPADVRAFLSVVEAMPFAVPDGAIHELLRRGAKRFHVFNVLSGENLAALSDPDIRVRLHTLRDALESLEQRRADLDLAAFVTDALEYTQFFYHLFAEGADLRVVDSISKRIFELVEQLIQKNEANLSAFIEAIQTLLDKKQFGEEDAPYVPKGRVVIMTQHQAKGLEFPAVAVPGIKNPRRSGGTYLVPGEGLYSSETKSWERDPASCEAAAKARIDREQEERCLLYVAMTRAKDYLFLSTPFPNGIDKHDKENLFASAARVLKNNEIPFEEWRETPTLDHVIDDAGSSAGGETDMLGALVDEWEAGRERLSQTRLLRKPTPQGLQFVSWRGLHTFSNCPLQYYYRYVAGIQDDVLAPRDEEAAEHDAGEPGIERLPAGMSPADFGGFVHRFMYEWLDGGSTSGDAARRVLGSLAARYHIKEDIRSKLIDATFELASAFGQDPKGAVYRLEWPIRSRRGNLVFHGVVDRVDKSEDGLHVIDYKLGIARDEYSYQIRFYAWIMRSLPGDPPSTGTVAYLHRKPGHHEVDVSSGSLRRLDATAEELEEALGSGDYHASPGIVCASCDFKGICPHAVS